MYLCFMIVTCHYLLKNTKINAITLYPFILLRKKKFRYNTVLLNHEKIHIRQQLECFVLFFYMIYLAEYFFLFIKFKNSYKAYRMISFEREAYDNEVDLEYLQRRKFWAFLKYWK